MTIRRRWWLLCSCGVVFLLACVGQPAEEEADDQRHASAAAGADRAPPGGSAVGSGVAEDARAEGGEGEFWPGFVVWESNRGGAWRIWTRQLAGGPPRRLSPDEPGRNHCCAHVSPDGKWVAYLSGEGGGEEYPPDGLLGKLHLIAPDGSGDRVVAPAARSYFENRAVVWRSPGELIHIEGERATVALDLASGESRRLADPPPERAWLIDPTLSWATTGRPEFAPYVAARAEVAPRHRLGGCQPYFSHDGRWGFWTSGAGGPINRVELATGRVGRMLDKNDARVPGGFGYAYFPMLSADARLFSWAASRGGHDHFSTDYEVFVAESDPDTLELIGPPRRITHDTASDRFPDVWQPPLGLGRHAGEAPLSVRLNAPSAVRLRWALGDGSSAEGAAVEHTWTEPGRYEVVAEGDETSLRGLVVVRPRRPPRPLAVTARAGGQVLVVGFDEPIDAADARLELVSGVAVVDSSVDADGRGLLVRLDEPLRVADGLTVSGVRDRAQQANTMVATTLPVEPPAWPVSRDGLVFLWETADAANLVPDPDLGVERTYTLTAAGKARLDADFAMIADGGTFSLQSSETARMRSAVQWTNELTFEATIETSADGRFVTWAGEKGINLWLERRSGTLSFGLRTGARGPAAYPRVDLFDLAAGVTAHLVVTYEPGRLAAFLDGEPKFESSAVQGGLFHWRELPLVFGDDSWVGRIEGVAIYNRVLSPGEVLEAHRLYLAKREARPVLRRTIVEARLVERSRTPTLAEISPYREALSMAFYEVERLISGPAVGGRPSVVEWVVLDGVEQEVTRSSPGDRFRLTLEPFARQPQLESVYLSNTLQGGSGPPLFVVDSAPVR